MKFTDCLKLAWDCPLHPWHLLSQRPQATLHILHLPKAWKSGKEDWFKRCEGGTDRRTSQQCHHLNKRGVLGAGYCGGEVAGQSVPVVPRKQHRTLCFCWKGLMARCFLRQGEVTTARCGGCCWHSSPEPAALHRGLINRLCKALRNFLGGSRGGRVVFNIIILRCYHNDCFERFDLLFFKEIFYLICRNPPRGGGRARSVKGSQLQPRAEKSPSFILLVYLLCRLMTWRDLKPLCLSISEVKHWAFFSRCDLQEAWHIP